jgi:hypothetical protein
MRVCCAMELRWLICVALWIPVVPEKKNAAVVSWDWVGEVKRFVGGAGTVS